MATDTLTASIPYYDLEPGMIIALEAIDAGTAAPVAGVKITAATIYAPGGPAGSSGDGSGAGLGILGPLLVRTVQG